MALVCAQSRPTKTHQTTTIKTRLLSRLVASAATYYVANTPLSLRIISDGRVSFFVMAPGGRSGPPLMPRLWPTGLRPARLWGLRPLLWGYAPPGLFNRLEGLILSFVEINLWL